MFQHGFLLDAFHFPKTKSTLTTNIRIVYYSQGLLPSHQRQLFRQQLFRQQLFRLLPALQQPWPRPLLLLQPLPRQPPLKYPHIVSHPVSFRATDTFFSVKQVRFRVFRYNPRKQASEFYFVDTETAAQTQSDAVRCRIARD